MKAIFSDVHANLEALQAVLADVARQSADAVYNLGDTTGYGPNPIECLDLAMRMPRVLLGNHDQAILSHPDGFGVVAEKSVFWTRSVLESSVEDPNIRQLRLGFLASLPSSHQEGNILYVHGSPRNPLNEYIFPEDIYHEKKISRIGELFDRICFNGHTHVPGIFVERGPGHWDFIPPEGCEGGFPLEDLRVICNVGSVGQPRDGDWRACYVLFDGAKIWFRRVEYSVGTTIHKIYSIPELDNFLGDRLRDGR